MYRSPKMTKTSIVRNETVEGERLELMLERISNNAEGIRAEAPIIYTERREGVRPELDIRTDKWELANEIKDAESRNRQLKRSARVDKENEAAKARLKDQADKNSGKPTSTDTTDNK